MPLARSHLWLLVACALLAAMLLSAAAAAQPAAEPTEDDKNKAAALVFEGDDKRKAGDHEAALAAYQRADKIMRVPTTGIEVARELAALGRLVAAHAKCAEVAAHPAQAAEPEAFANARNEAALLTKDLAARIATLQLRVKGLEEGAEVEISVDGKPVAPSADPLRLDPGKHTVTARSGAASATKSLSLKEGEQRELELELQSSDAGPSEDVAPILEPVAGGDGGGLSPLVWVGFGVGAAGIVAGAVTGIITLAKTASLEDACGGHSCSTDYQEDVDLAVTLSHVSTISFAVGGAGVGVGVVALILSLSDSEPGVEEAAMQLWLEQGVVGLKGSF